VRVPCAVCVCSPDLINTLWPTGTTARADLEALTALRTQVPEALKELQASPPARPSSSAFAPPDPSAVLSSLATLAEPSKRDELKEEVKDLLRSTPKGLETPEYAVVATVDGPLSLGQPSLIELRQYEPFTVARITMSTAEAAFGSSAGADGFNALASCATAFPTAGCATAELCAAQPRGWIARGRYLFGGNAEKRSMAMTMPVEVASGGGTGSMSFVLPAREAGAPPTPLDGSDVTIETVPRRLVAAKPFAGLVTNAEVERQQAALVDALAADGRYAPLEASACSVLQYNSPLTIPWRRRNEFALVVEEVAAEAEEAAEEEVAVPTVESWYDAGVRLQAEAQEDME
jgi:hypothetical protein